MFGNKKRQRRLGFLNQLSRILSWCQQSLFPALEETVGPLSTRLQRLVAVIELVALEEHVQGPSFETRGRPQADRRSLARAFMAKAVLNLADTRSLIDYLHESPTTRRLCGWSHHGEILDDLPTHCDIGRKHNSKGRMEQWAGYSFHVDWADGEIPISCILTSASMHDSQAAIPLAKISAQRVTSLYDLMDAAYDDALIREHCIALNHVPIIDHNPRRKSKQHFDPAKAQRFSLRSSAERGFSRIKDGFGARYVRVRGHPKVFAHLMFGILALTVEQLFRAAS